MVTFTRAPTVAVGQPITNTEHALVAAAFNDRFRSGIAEPWRVVFQWFTLFRQVRNSDGLYSFPPQAEFFQVYQHLDPLNANWPTGFPGLPEGMNIASMWGSFVFGTDEGGISAEEDRLLGVELFYNGHIPLNEFQAWELGKIQRGGYDELSVARAAPCLDASESHFRLYQGPKSPHGNSYGSFLPGPEYIGTCADGTTPQFAYTFTTLDGGTTANYTGSCCLDTVADLAIIAEYPDVIYVVLCDGTLIQYSTSEWVQGPYTGAATLRRTQSKMLERCLAYFAAEHRGSTSQRARTEPWMGEAFSFQNFFTRQYLLAPARGSASGDVMNPEYPIMSVEFSAPIDDGQQLNFFSNTGYPTHAGFVIAAVFISAENVAGSSIELEFTDNDVTYERVSVPLTAGIAGKIHVFTSARQAAPFGVRLANSIVPSGGTATIEVEIAELVDYKPKIWDAYLMLRLSGCQEFDAPIDAKGPDETQSRIMWENYGSLACIKNIYGVAQVMPKLAEINTNAVYDAARRLSKMVRIIPRRQLMPTGYEVGGDGKSVLYFKRYAFNLHQSNPVDLFEGIAPARLPIESGDIARGIEYTVRTGGVTYYDVYYGTGSTFTGIANVTEFEGSGEVFEAEGIRATAPPQGWTNEWLMSCDFKAYHPSVSSAWNPDAFADQFAFNDRCSWTAPEIGLDKQLRNHLAYGQYSADGYTVLAEQPSSMRYILPPSASLNVNSIPCAVGDVPCETWRQNSYFSCRIYEPWPEIESATAFIENGIELVKLKFKTRFHHFTTADSLIDRDPTTWVNLGLDGRTMENGIMEYILNQTTGAHCTAGGIPPSLPGGPTGQPGNAGANSDIATFPDNPHGSCYPDFFFMKLVESPYQDSNDTPDDHDTAITFDQKVMQEIYLRAMCEGFVDETATSERTCSTGQGLYNYTYENLHFYANGNRWFPLMASTRRDDNAQGFFPFPTTEVMAEWFNQMSRALNLLTKVPLTLPMTIECLDQAYSGQAPITPDWPSPTSCNSVSPGSATRGVARLGGIGESAVMPLATWADCTGPLSTGGVSSISLPLGCPTANTFYQGQNHNTIQYRFKFSDSAHSYALPPTISDMIATNSVGFLGYYTEGQGYIGRYAVSAMVDAAQCGASYLWDGTTGYNFVTHGTSRSYCGLFSGGLIDPYELDSPHGDTWIQGDGLFACSDGWGVNKSITPFGQSTDRFLVVQLV